MKNKMYISRKLRKYIDGVENDPPPKIRRDQIKLIISKNFEVLKDQISMAKKLLVPERISRLGKEEMKLKGKKEKEHT